MIEENQLAEAKVDAIRNKSQTLGYILPFFLFFIALCYLVRNNAFFWDTLQLGSLHGHWFFENGFGQLILPEEINSGHPPLFGMYMALIWMIFGKSLAVSHFAMLPIIFGIVYQLYLSGSYFFQGKAVILVLLLSIADPCLLGQSALMSPDLVLIFFFFLSLNAILFHKNTLLILGLIGLSLISLRGMMVAAALFIFQLINYYMTSGRIPTLGQLLRFIVPYLPGGFLVFCFLLYHYLETGWIGYHENSPWAPSFEKIDLNGFIRNIAIFIWRLLDFGRVFFVIIVLGLGFRMWRRRIKPDYKLLQLLVLLISLCVLLVPSLLIHKNISAHRYLLSVFLLIDLIALYGIINYISIKKRRNTLLWIGLAGLFLGNFWVYPNKISQSWDSTLAHLPYFNLRKEMINYLAAESIPIEEVGSAFPNLRTFEETDLAGGDVKFAEKNLEYNEYIFYSNIFNDFTDEEIDELENTWKKQKEFKMMGVCTVLYKRRD